jgi:hypothetical protein
MSTADAALPAADAALSAADAALVAASLQAARTTLLGNCGATTSSYGTPWRRVLADAALALEVFDADVPGDSMRVFKGVCELPFPPRAALAALADHAARPRWDANIAFIEALPLGAASLLHSVTKAVGPIAARDFVDVCVLYEVGAGGAAAPAPAGPDAWAAPAGTVVSGGVGVAADARFAAGAGAAAGAVRGINGSSGWVFEPLAGGARSRCHYVIHTHLAGWLPAFVINSSLAGNYVSFFRDLNARLSALAAEAPAVA